MKDGDIQTEEKYTCLCGKGKCGEFTDPYYIKPGTNLGFRYKSCLIAYEKQCEQEALNAGIRISKTSPW